MTQDRPTPRVRSPSQKEMEEMKRMLHSISDSPASPSVRSSVSKRNITVIAAVVAVLLVCVAGSVLIRKYLSEGGSMCGAPACKAYSELLHNTVNEDVNPCQDFYRHVCHGWTKRRSHSVQRDAFEAFQDSVASAAAQVSVRDTVPQSAYQKAATLYQTCASTERSNDELGQFRELMRDSGVSWPYASNDTDILKPLFKLPTVIYMDTVLAVHLRDGLGGQPTVVFQPSDCCGSIFAARNDREYRNYFLAARELMADAGQGWTTFEELEAVEEEIVPHLADSLQQSAKTWQGDWSEIFTPGITQERWNQALSAYLQLPLTTSPRAEIVNVRFFRDFFNAAATTGENKMHMYIGWFFVQSLLAFTSRTPCNAGQPRRRLRGDEKKKTVQNFCIAVVHRLMGYAFYQQYVADVATPSNTEDVTSIIRSIREAFSTVLRGSKWYNYTAAAFEPSQRGMDRALEFADKARSEHVMRSYGKYSEMRRKFTVNWMTAHQGLSKSRRGDVVPPPFFVNGTPVFYVLKEGSKDFVLMPYALDIPFYDLQAPLPIRYGALGSLVASALAALVFRGASTWNQKAEVVANQKVQCLFGKDKTVASLSVQEMDQLYSTSALGALWEAFQVKSRRYGSTVLRFGRREWSASQEKMFFVVWCYVRCGTKATSDSCNVPLKHTSHFSRIFGCPKGSAMSAKPQCRIFSG